MDSRPKTQDVRPKTQDPRHKTGSAIILAIVLTSLLAIVGVLFLLSSRIDSIATSAIADNKNLTLAVDSVIAQISEDLVLDVNKSIDPNYYADYPDGNNYWLASLEPNDANMWPHITDLYGQGVSAFNVDINRIYEYDKSKPAAYDKEADADGDGAGDSVWVPIRNVSSSKGKPIFAAVRIIDNGGMLNVNTGDLFNSSSSVGASQTDINIMSLSWRQVGGSYNPASENALHFARNPLSRPPLSYESDVIWRYENPDFNYTPFDISDELEMRYRFLIDQNDIRTRLESWSGEFARSTVRNLPFDNSGGANVTDDWSTRARYVNSAEQYYAYRHIATTYNFDRVITPAGQKMANINTAPETDILSAVKAGLNDAGVGDVNALAAQITANLIDYRDDDSNVTVINDNNFPVSLPHFGFETPCIYISEMAVKVVNIDPNANTVARSYALELYNPYRSQIDPNNKWQLSISSSPNTIPVTWPGNSAFYVILNEDINAPIPFDANATDFNQISDPNVVFGSNDTILLQRDVNGFGFITVDALSIPPEAGIVPGPNLFDSNTFDYQRDISHNKCIRRLWWPSINDPYQMTIGGRNLFVDTDANVIQALPANKPFTNVGEFGQLFYAPVYHYGGFGADFTITVTEPNLRIDLNEPAYQQVFKYLTVFDPNDHVPDPNETRIKGRININTAPWFVIAQLPWISYHDPNYDLARTIVAYRDKTIGPGNIDFAAIRTDPPGFRSIGELMRVTNALNDANSIGYYENQPVVPTFLMTPSDGAGDIFEQRDVIFARISNLVTVRSDAFTAYILVRIGKDGPQKRVVAILDRSGVPKKPVKVVAIQSVPDPR